MLFLTEFLSGHQYASPVGGLGEEGLGRVQFTKNELPCSPFGSGWLKHLLPGSFPLPNTTRTSVPVLYLKGNKCKSKNKIKTVDSFQVYVGLEYNGSFHCVRGLGTATWGRNVKLWLVSRSALAIIPLDHSQIMPSSYLEMSFPGSLPSEY